MWASFHLYYNHQRACLNAAPGPKFDCKGLSGILFIGSPATGDTMFAWRRAQINTEIDMWALPIFPLKGPGLPRAQWRSWRWAPPGTIQYLKACSQKGPGPGLSPHKHRGWGPTRRALTGFGGFSLCLFLLLWALRGANGIWHTVLLGLQRCIFLCLPLLANFWGSTGQGDWLYQPGNTDNSRRFEKQDLPSSSHPSKGNTNRESLNSYWRHSVDTILHFHSFHKVFL